MITATPIAAHMAALNELERQKRELLKLIAFERDGLSVRPTSPSVVSITDKDGDVVLVNEEEAKWLVECFTVLYGWTQ